MELAEFRMVFLFIDMAAVGLAESNDTAFFAPGLAMGRGKVG